MIPETGRIQSLPVHVLYNHPSLPSIDHLSSSSSSSSSLCSLILPSIQDVFVHRPSRQPNGSGVGQGRKRRRLDIKLEDERHMGESMDRNGRERSGSVQSQVVDVDDQEEDWFGSIALKSLIKAICYASPDLMPSLSVPDSSIYLPSTTTTDNSSSSRTLYEGKGLLSLILTEPTPGRTIVRGRLLQSSLFTGISDVVHSDDDDDEEDGGGLEALVRAANKRKEREEESGWGLEVELVLRPVGGRGGSSFAASSPIQPFGSGMGMGMGGGYDRSSPALGIGLGNSNGNGVGESYEPRQLTNTRVMVSSPMMARRRSRTDEVRDWDREGRVGRAGSVPSFMGRTWSGDDGMSGLQQEMDEEGSNLQLPPAYQSSQSPPSSRPPILTRNVRPSVGPSRQPPSGTTNAQLRSTSTRPPSTGTNSKSTSTPSSMVNNPEFQILPPRSSQPPRPGSRAQSKAPAPVVRSGSQRLREGLAVPKSDPAVGNGRTTKTAVLTTNRSASVEPQQSSAQASSSRTPASTTATVSASLLKTPTQTMSTLPPVIGIDVRASPASGNPMALARSILRNPTVHTMELAQKLIGKEALIQLLSEMGVDLPASATSSKPVAGTSAAGSKPKTPPRGKFVPPPRNLNNENRGNPSAQSKAQAVAGPSKALTATATAAAPGSTTNATVIHRCDNCGTTQTSLWRTKVTAVGKEKRVCNDCGLYFNDKKRMRPKSLWGLKGDAALGKEDSATDTEGKTATNARPRPRIVGPKSQEPPAGERGPSEEPARPPASPHRPKRPSDAFASPRRSTRLKTGQTPKLSPARPPSSEGFNGIEDSPSKHLRLTPRRKAQARNMEHELNSHAKFTFGGDKQGQPQQQPTRTHTKQNGGLAASPFASASASTETSQPATAAPTEHPDWDEHIRRLFTNEGIPPGSDLLVNTNELDSAGNFAETDLDIQELLNAVAADPVDSNDGQALLGANFTQAEIEMLLSTMGNADVKATRDLEWQPFSTSPWSVEQNTPAAAATGGQSNKGVGTSAGVPT